MKMKSFVFGLLALPVIVSCNSDDAPSIENADREIALSLSLDKRLSGRASVSDDMLDDENYIVGGDYAIIMKLDGYENQPHCCRFGTSVLDNGRRGIIYIVGDGTPATAPLKWSNIDVRSFDFTIDNIGYTEECRYDADSGFLGRVWSDDEKSVTYAAQRERYNAGGTPKHTNDIIWGRGTALYGVDGKEVSYAELTHRMTRVNVAFVNLEEQYSNMTVKLTNLVLKPESFNRADGTVAIGENPDRTELVMLYGDDPADRLTEIHDETAEGEYLEHVTANYILPPQPLTESLWPRIVVSYTDVSGTPREVSGLIPHDILNEDGNTWEALDGLNAGDHLTIVAEINDEIPEIVFTAKVRKWVDLGPMTVSADQATGETPGIRSLEELERCIELYNDLPQFQYPDEWDAVWSAQQRLKHFGELMQYGDCEVEYLDEYKNSGIVKWRFYINFPLTEDDLPTTRFRYMLSKVADDFPDLTVLKTYVYPLTFVDNGSSSVDLKSLIGAKGIYNMEDLNHMIKAVNEQRIDFMLLYGEAKPGSDRWYYTVDIRDDFSGDLIRGIDPEKLFFEGRPIEVVLKDNDFTVNGHKGDEIGKYIGL